MDITTEEATKIIKNFIDYFNKNKDDGNKANLCVLGEEIKAIEKVLNELDTLQNGFNTAVEHQTELIRENTNFRYQLFNNQKELEKKDKIIDAMAEEIEKFGCISTEVFNSAKECMNMQNCIDCIKQYFERKVKDE